LCDVAADCACKESSTLYLPFLTSLLDAVRCQFTPLPTMQHNKTQTHDAKQHEKPRARSCARVPYNTTSLQKCYA
jgi:hypothetical protein